MIAFKSNETKIKKKLNVLYFLHFKINKCYSVCRADIVLGGEETDAFRIQDGTSKKKFKPTTRRRMIDIRTSFRLVSVFFSNQNTSIDHISIE